MFKQVIYYFMAVVEEGSFSKAAKKYYLSQSAISQQITKLEKDLGFSLFNRKTYCPTLTKEGKRYYDLAKRLIDDYNNEYEDILYNANNDLLTLQKTSKQGVSKFDGTTIIPIEYDNIFLLVNT